ncbi:hypothetical protein NVIE_1933 [Nitrososphaera viennensis EN76]|uniref:Uncharacterized protein n=1 Tax=Nitrososphaera viennensis EN76 TaxID=926571 RepID=A0A060HRI4_9ARCH|nr:hypothetical protein NVIE_1933 [Nitrososphaera viennensis EN76]
MNLSIHVRIVEAERLMADALTHDAHQTRNNATRNSTPKRDTHRFNGTNILVG